MVAIALSSLSGCYSARVLDSHRAVELWRAELPAPRAADAAPADSMVADAWALAALALERSPTLEVAAARVAAAEASVDAAGTVGELELRVTNLRLRRFASGDPEVDLALRYRPPRPGVSQSDEDQARLDAVVEASEATDARRRVVAATRRLHARVLLAEAARAGAASEVEQWAQHLALLQRMVDAHEATDLEVQIAALEYAESLDRVAERTQERDIALSQLRRLLDLPMDAAVSLTGQPGGVSTAPLADARTLIEEALTRRPETRAASARLAGAEAAIWRAKAEQWPWLGFVQLGYEASKSSNHLDFGLGFSVDLPLFAWMGGEVSAMEARASRRRVEERATLRGIAREVEMARTRVAASRARLDTVESSLLVASDAAAAAAARARANGVVSVSRELSLLGSQARIRRRHLEAREEWILARIELDEVLGVMGPP